MKIKEISKTLANKINQEHYIMHYLEKIQRGSYNKGFKDAQSKKLTLTDVVSSKLNDWVKIDPTKANTIPEKPVWIMTIDSKEIEYKEADEYIELNYASHYRLIDKPEPPL